MKIYQDDGYLNMAGIIERGDTFNFLVGGRGIGKTYGAIKYCIEHKIKFIYMRRTDTIIQTIVNSELSPVRPVMSDLGEISTVEKINKYVTGFYRGETGEDGTITERDTGFDRQEYARLYMNDGGLFPIRNYICAPDIFRYCVNAYDTSISSAFRYGSPLITGDGCGLKGTIPPFIFEPLSEITLIQGVFEYCRGILPYKWAKYVNGVMTEQGVAYPPTLLSKLTRLYMFSGVFSNTTMWGGVIVPDTLFSANQVLSDISGLWGSVTWVEKELYQFPTTMFINNRNLTNVSSLFYMNGPRKIQSQLFTYISNPKINNCSGFIYRGTNVSSDSTVPTFWESPWYENMANFTGAYYGVSVSSQTIPPEFCTPS